MPERRRLLLVSHLPLHHHEGGTVRWRYFAEALPEHGWDVRVVSAPAEQRHHGNVAVEHQTTRARRAVRTGARAVVQTGRAAGLDPTAFFPDPLWAVRGRRSIAAALARWRPDVIYATIPPVATMFAAAGVARRSDIPLVLEFRDLWAGQPDKHNESPWLLTLQSRPVAVAARVVCTTPEACARLGALHAGLADRLVMVPNGYDPRLLAMRRPRSRHRDGPARLVHAGSLYGTRSIDGLLAALTGPALRGRARLELVGAVNDRSAAAIEAVRGAVDVEVRPPTTWERAIEATAQADVAVVVFTPGDATAVPGKLYEALALGVPVLALVSADSALERQLREMGVDAEVARHDDPVAIAAALDSLLQYPPAPATPEELAPYDRSRLAARLAGVLEEVATQRPPARPPAAAPAPARAAAGARRRSRSR